MILQSRQSRTYSKGYASESWVAQSVGTAWQLPYHFSVRCGKILFCHKNLILSYHVLVKTLIDVGDLLLLIYPIMVCS